MLSPQFLDELRDRVTLSSLVGRTTPLKKAGNEYKACCPFHQEKTPSFWVNDQKGFYHCFGCGVHGDAVRWLTEARGLSFMDAVKELAEQVGMELPKPTAEEQQRRERSAGLQEIMEAAADYFQSALTQTGGAGARAYLVQREISQESLRDFRIGYAPDGRSNLRNGLNHFSAAQLVEAGLLVSVEDKEPYDRFRSRVMVPIRDSRGRVIAFGGRILGDGEPKYLNSPDTPLFDKGRVLFNLDRAGPASRQANRVVVVEGYFDVIALDQVGIREAVAPMGTALTEAQLEQLWRLVDEPILCFDGDSAGVKAARRAAERALASLRPGKQLLIAVLPPGKDPDDLLRESGAEVFEKVLDQALPLSSFIYRSEAAKIDRERPEQRAGLRQRLEEIASTCPDRLVADEFGRSFRSFFFEDFGWKKKQRQTIATSSIRTSARVAPQLARSFVRSALHGLTRFPSIAVEDLDGLAAIPIAHADLQRWRDAIGETLIQNPHLEDDGIEEILKTFVLPEILRFDVRTDLRFGFMRSDWERQRAVKQVRTLVRFLSQEREISDQMAELDARAAADSTGDKWEAIEVSRQRLRAAKASMIEEAGAWGDEFEEA